MALGSMYVSSGLLQGWGSDLRTIGLRSEGDYQVSRLIVSFPPTQVLLTVLTKFHDPLSSVAFPDPHLAVDLCL